MRYSSDHKAETRERVLKEAATAIRRDGVDRVGVAQVMGAAGLTHGGFYAHFASKDDLVAQAVEFMFQDRYAAFFDGLEEVEPRDALTRFVDRYLSMRHRDARDAGCPIPVLAGQLPHLPEAAQARFVTAVERLTDAVASLLRRLGAAEVEAVSSAVIAEMVGAVALARVHADDAKAEAMLASVRESVKAKLRIGA
jgi:TetR/AcrR family transcriptional repressor of nem operon